MLMVVVHRKVSRSPVQLMIYSLWLFDRHCECIYTRHWNRGQREQAKESAENDDDDAKLLFGVVFSLRNMVQKLDPSIESTSPYGTGSGGEFVSYRTSAYKLHYYESPTSLKFIMISDIKVDSLRLVLHQIYVSLYVEYVVKNSLASVEHGRLNKDEEGEGVGVELFNMALDSFVTSLDAFK